MTRSAERRRTRGPRRPRTDIVSRMRSRAASTLRRRRPRGPATRISATIAVAVAVVTLAGGSATAAGGKLLFQDSLQRPSAAIKQQQAAGLSIAFVNHQLLIKSIGSGFVFLAPRFSSNGSRLAAVHVDVDVSLGPTTIAGLFCRGPNANSFYDFVVDTDHTLSINKAKAGGATGLASENIASANQYHLSVECSGPARPGPTGKVHLQVGVSTPKEGDKATFTDRSAAFGAGPVGLIVAGDSGQSGSASFSNLTVRQG
jgi:hypothetical protein